MDPFEPRYDKLRQGLTDKREFHNRTLRDVAGVIKVAPTTLQQWEKGVSQPTAANLMRWCDALGYDIFFQKKETNGRPLPNRAPRNRM